MFRMITANRPDRCRRCQGDIPPGTKIRYGGPGRIYHLKRDCPAGDTPSERSPRRGPVDDTPGALASYYDPRGVYAANGTFLGTTGPRCEDAPCCGCCS